MTADSTDSVKLREIADELRLTGELDATWLVDIAEELRAIADRLEASQQPEQETQSGR